LSDQKAASVSPPAGAYRVLARTYRPQRFSELIGQDALVRTLGIALRTGRIAHAFLLTGIRGVGKTTTARIIARALNCIGEDGKGLPTPEPCGGCEHCRSIADGRHIDVLEMDAATHTGIDDVRELVDSVRYAPTSARYKVYIVDEVHMLSEKAFNGLLKTLEEPPAQTIFIFATTEVRKVPITVLSRCQRFDLRRIEAALLQSYFRTIAEKEGIEIEAGALALIGRNAQGSARDGLSLLDQAIALGGGTAITQAQVQDMLGLADRNRLLDLFEAIAAGEVQEALANLEDLYARGSEPEAVVQDLLEISHWLTRLKIAAEAVEESDAGPWDAARGKVLAGRMTIADLSRFWQMLLKGLDDLRIAPSPLLAADMLIVRLAFAADLPSAEALLAQLNGEAPPAPGPAPARTSPAVGAAPALAAPLAARIAARTEPLAPPPASRPVHGPGDAARQQKSAQGQGATVTPLPVREPVAPQPAPEASAAPPAVPETFAAAIELFRARGKPLLYGWLHGRARLVRFAEGVIELERGDVLLTERRQEIASCLADWTGRPWQIVESDAPGAPSLTDQEAIAKQERISALAEDPRVRPVLETFPGARIVDVRNPAAGGAADSIEHGSETR
jgi:DNA polymerase-3 subunit gamma/tau